MSLRHPRYYKALTFACLSPSIFNRNNQTRNNRLGKRKTGHIHLVTMRSTLTFICTFLCISPTLAVPALQDATTPSTQFVKRYSLLLHYLLVPYPSPPSHGLSSYSSAALYATNKLTHLAFVQLRSCGRVSSGGSAGQFDLPTFLLQLRSVLRMQQRPSCIVGLPSWAGVQLGADAL